MIYEQIVKNFYGVHFWDGNKSKIGVSISFLPCMCERELTRNQQISTMISDNRINWSFFHGILSKINQYQKKNVKKITIEL